MIIKQDIKIRILLTVLSVAMLAMILLFGYFNRNKSYGCTIQIVDADNGTVLMRFEATCKDGGQETDRDPYYTNRVYSVEAYSVEDEKQRNDNIHENNFWNAERDAWHQADIK
ncbi:hypothetical protein [Sphingobacterium paucimobilis]|uniref:Uncharacterized protein n=1 Tax=Sphingobacterium paucimobilis HER1398 TaxID=1346330 RepID=U2J473_9SPHI|nr:hypothetical protein [Sphingobacterium paucimobilis]ERJ57448.1 hypothetical protein M472_01580 [Sphingobacterium paucimobilis HER1398]